MRLLFFWVVELKWACGRKSSLKFFRNRRTLNFLFFDWGGLDFSLLFLRNENIFRRMYMPNCESFGIRRTLNFLLFYRGGRDYRLLFLRNENIFGLMYMPNCKSFGIRWNFNFLFFDWAGLDFSLFLYKWFLSCTLFFKLLKISNKLFIFRFLNSQVFFRFFSLL